MLAPGGRYVEIAMTGLRSAGRFDLSSMTDNQMLISVDLSRLLARHPERVREYLDAMAEHLRAGTVQPTIAATYPFSKVKEAYAHLKNRGNIGKVVVSLDEGRVRTPEILEPAAPRTGDRPDRDIAVIGMAGRFPGARNVHEFWQHLSAGRLLVTEAPEERWDPADFFDPDPNRMDKTHCKWGGFLDDIDQFDPLFFHMSGQEAEATDPQQRLFLQECWTALEDAGYVGRIASGLRCGVFAGVSPGDYQMRMQAPGVSSGASTFWGNAGSILAARISYFLNLKGPSIAIDTACSSSLVAIHLGCRSILSGECDMALAGGVFVATTPMFHILASNAGMLSPEGLCKTFDAGADGFVPGEGVGLVVLKSLSTAIADRDHIYGVIKGSGVNQDGKTNGITAPSTLSQTDLEVSVYRESGIHPETIGYVETHGTGTQLGDPVEIDALTHAFRRFTRKKQFCAVGSVKTNMGHAAAAAGVASVIKVLLCLKHRQIAPSLNFKTENPHIHFQEGPFYVNTRLQPWEAQSATPRRAAVSAFGFSGTNAHIIFEEFPGDGMRRGQEKIEEGEEGRADLTASRAAPQLFLLSAKDEERLQDLVAGFLDFLKEQASASRDPALDTENIAYTLMVGRQAMPERLAVVAGGIEILAEKLDAFIRGKADVAELFRGRARRRPVQDGKADPEALMRRRDLSSLGRLWVSGLDMDWTPLFAGASPARVPLPTYPFARERYWVPTARVPVPASDALFPAEAAHRLPPGENRLHYFKRAWIPAGPVTGTSPDGTGEILLVLDTEENRSRRLEKRLQAEVVLVQPGKRFARRGGDRYTLRPGKAVDYLRLWRDLEKQNRLPSSLIHLWGLEDPDLGRRDAIPADDGTERGWAPMEVGIHSVFGAIRAAAATGDSLRRFLFLFRETPGEEVSFFEAVSGYGRSLPFVVPELSFASVQLSSEMPEEALADLLQQELACLGTRPVSAVRHENGVRLELRSEPFILDASGSLPFREGGVYLITGGAGAIGSRFAEHLFRAYGARVILTGRSVPAGKKQKRIDRLKGQGAEIAYIRADVADVDAMKAAVDAAREAFGPINGVIHAAGGLTETTILEKEEDAFRSALGPKIQGTLVVDRVTRGEPLDFFALFSSVSALLGDFGQCDYAVANTFMDSYARVREAQHRRGEAPGKTLSINWPVWREGGMGANPDAERLYLQTSGMDYLETRQGIAAFEDMLRSSPCQVALFSGEADRIRGFLGVDDEAISEGEAPAPSIDDTVIADDLRAEAAAILKIPARRLDLEESLGSFGFDSLSLKTFADRIGSLYGIRISPAVFFANSSLRALCAHLRNAHGSELEKVYRNRPSDSGSGQPATLLPLQQAASTSASGPGPGRHRLAAVQPIAIVGA
ncbi:MAG: SDR family NAD(P)-dependent oxidoreductase, partial [Desulfobacteraceae bacterium]|nr:SDR family NAD(P)-dependent oxidoreductase [Desulfobacteraceae bacterium]